MIGNGTPTSDPPSNFGLVTYSYNVETPVDVIRAAFSEQLRGPTSVWEITAEQPTRVPEPDTHEHSAEGDLKIDHPAFDDETSITLTSQLHKDGETPTEYYTTYSVHVKHSGRVRIPTSHESDFETALESALTEANTELNDQTRFARAESIIHRLKNTV